MCKINFKWTNSRWIFSRGEFGTNMQFPIAEQMFGFIEVPVRYKAVTAIPSFIGVLNVAILLMFIFDQGSVWSQPHCLPCWVRGEQTFKQLHPWTLERMGNSPGSPRWTEAKQWAFSEQIFWEKPKWWWCGRVSGAVPSHRGRSMKTGIRTDESLSALFLGVFASGNTINTSSKKLLTAVLEIASEIGERRNWSVESRDSCSCLWWEMSYSSEVWAVLKLEFYLHFYPFFSYFVGGGFLILCDLCPLTTRKGILVKERESLSLIRRK